MLPYGSSVRLTHKTSVFISLSMLVLLNFVLPQFCISLVCSPVEENGNNYQSWNIMDHQGLLYEFVTARNTERNTVEANGCGEWNHQNKNIIPANITIPKHHSVFLSTQPRSSIFSLSRGYLLSLQYNVPVNLSSLLFGGSQMTSPEGKERDSHNNNHYCKEKIIDTHTYTKYPQMKKLNKTKYSSHHQSPSVLRYLPNLRWQTRPDELSDLSLCKGKIEDFSTVT